MFFSQNTYPKVFDKDAPNASNIGRATTAMNLIAQLANLSNLQSIELTWSEHQREVMPHFNIKFYNNAEQSDCDGAS